MLGVFFDTDLHLPSLKLRQGRQINTDFLYLACGSCRTEVLTKADHRRFLFISHHEEHRDYPLSFPRTCPELARGERGRTVEGSGNPKNV